MRRSLLLLIKAATSFLLLYFSLRWVNVGALAERFSRFEPGWAALGFLLLTAQIVLLAARWREIVTVCGTTLAFYSAFQITSLLHSSSGAAIDSWRRRRTDLVVGAKGRRLGKRDLFGIG
jgi:hypothetical protein